MIDTAAYGRERGELLDRIVKHLEADPSTAAVWLGGSFGRRQADDLSDLDLWVAVDEVRLPAIVANPVAFVRVMTPTIMEIHAPLNAPPGGAYLLTWIDGASGPQQVDWYWLPVNGAVRPFPSRLLFERQPISIEPVRQRLSEEELDSALAGAVRDSMLMAFIAAKHARRGNPWTAAGQMVHLASCLGRVEWLLDPGTSPLFDDRASVPLPPGIPTTSEAQLAWIREALGRTLARLDVERPVPRDAFDPAVRAIERWLGTQTLRPSLTRPHPHTLPGDPPAHGAG